MTDLNPGQPEVLPIRRRCFGLLVMFGIMKTWTRTLLQELTAGDVRTPRRILRKEYRINDKGRAGEGFMLWTCP